MRMAPSKILNVQNKQSSTNVIRKGITTRSQNSALNNVLLKAPANGKESRVKRKAEASPPKEKTTKRSALGNITNVCHFFIFYFNFFIFYNIK